MVRPGSKKFLNPKTSTVGHKPTPPWRLLLPGGYPTYGLRVIHYPLAAHTSFLKTIACCPHAVRDLLRPAGLLLTRIEGRFGLDTLTAASGAHHALADLPDRHVLRQIYCGRVQVLLPAAIVAVDPDQTLLADEIGQGDRVHRRLLRDATRRDGRDAARRDDRDAPPPRYRSLNRYGTTVS